VLDDLGVELGVEWKVAKDEGREEALQRVTFVGVDLDVSGEPTLRVDRKKLVRYGVQLQKVREALRVEGSVARGEVRTLVGQLAFAARACRWGRVQLAGLYAWQESGGGNWVRATTPEAEENLDFWEELLRGEGAWEGRTRWSTARWDLVKGTNYFEQGGDAAGEENLGWGAVFGFERAAGDFYGEELEWHIAWKELIAVLRGFELWADNYEGRRVVVWSDNISVVAAINSGTTGDPTGRRVLKLLIKMATERGVDLRAKHIAGKLNVVSDELSRKKSAPSSADYKLASHVYHDCLSRGGWGDDRPEIDMFCDAQGRNAQERRDVGRGVGFCSVQDPPTVERVRGRMVWFNPPWALVGEALEMLEKAWREDPGGTRAVGVVPAWEERWWWSRFIGRRKAPFRVLGEVGKYTSGVFLNTGSAAFRVHGADPTLAGPTPFKLVMVAIGGYGGGAG